MATDEKSKNLLYLEERFDQPTAEAIRGLAREEALAVIDDMRQEVQDLVQRQAANIEADKASGSKKAGDTNAGTRKVQAADAAVKDAAAGPTPEKQTVAAVKLQEAESAVSELEREIDQLELRVVTLQDKQNQLEHDQKGISPLLAGGVLFVASFIVLFVVALFSPSLTIWEAFWYSLLGGLIALVASLLFNRLTAPKSDESKQKQAKKGWFRKTKKSESKDDDAGTEIFEENHERQPVGASH